MVKVEVSDGFTTSVFYSSSVSFVDPKDEETPPIDNPDEPIDNPVDPDIEIEPKPDVIPEESTKKGCKSCKGGIIIIPILSLIGLIYIFKRRK